MNNTINLELDSAKSLAKISTAPFAEEADSALANLEAARCALAGATSILEVKTIADLASAAKIYLQRSKASAETIYAATDLRIRAERRLGELISDAQRTGKLRTPDDGRSKGIADHDTLTLADLNISPDASSRAQKPAAIPEKEFEKRLCVAQDGGALSLARILREVSVRRARQSSKPTTPKARNKAARKNEPESAAKNPPPAPPALRAEDEALEAFLPWKIVASVPKADLSKDFSALKTRCEKWLQTMQADFPAFTLHEIAFAAAGFAIRMMTEEATPAS
jgi:hypothetical protein